jgi:hypothetical protein
MLGDAGHHGAIQAPKLGKKDAVVERSVDTSGDCPAFYLIRMHRSPDLGPKLAQRIKALGVRNG